MIQFFNRIYTSIENRNKILEYFKFYSGLRFTTRLLVNIIVPIYFLATKGSKKYSINTSHKNKGKIIVSLTSFPARINRVWIVIETILRQTQKPDMIVL